MYIHVLYSAKRWRRKTLVVSLVNPEPFAKLLLIQICIIKLRVLTPRQINTEEIAGTWMAEISRY